jgi:hypothetical protein
MTSTTETVAKLFEDAIALERRAETLYRQLEKMFAGCPDVARFWKHYADEENGHALYLERVRAGVDEGRLSQPANEDMMRKVRDCLEMSSPAILENVKTLDDAHQLATELENSETNAIFEFIILNFSTDELAKSHAFLRTQLNTHIARLEEDFPNPYKSRTTRQKVLAWQ